jgi:hypothetical protein|tara:strand:- start:1595 stop:2269 length:675 start_codon:yes stop_codon:yes gene_type:complete
MKKIVFLAVVALIIASCGNNSNSKTKIEQVRLDSIEQIKIDSLATVKIIQDSIVQIEIFEKAKVEYHKTLNLRKKYIGFKYEYPKSTDFIAEYGSPETLNGTDNNKWIVYFPKGNLTVVSNKKTDKFENICVGKYSNLKYDVTAELSKLIGKKMKYYDYVEKVSSIRYGSSEKLGMTNCLNKDCVEYYSKGNFTTVAFMEFNDKGDFVTLKKIAIGKVPRLNEY